MQTNKKFSTKQKKAKSEARYKWILRKKKRWMREILVEWRTFIWSPIHPVLYMVLHSAQWGVLIAYWDWYATEQFLWTSAETQNSSSEVEYPQIVDLVKTRKGTVHDLVCSQMQDRYLFLVYFIILNTYLVTSSSGDCEGTDRHTLQRSTSLL